jgi:hypothetical protein
MEFGVEIASLVVVRFCSTTVFGLANQDARTEHRLGYNRAMNMLKDSPKLWGEIKRSASQYEDSGEESV